MTARRGVVRGLALAVAVGGCSTPVNTIVVGDVAPAGEDAGPARDARRPPPVWSTARA